MPLHGMAVCDLTYSVCLLFSYLSYVLLDYSETCVIIYLMYTLEVQKFSDFIILLLNIAPECTLHNKVKDSIIYNSVVICFYYTIPL